MQSMKRILFFLCGLTMMLGLNNNVSAQVSIGISEPPVEGALLQVKNIENAGTASNSTKGVLLPRVSLKEIDMLYPMFPKGYDKGFQDAMHAGLLVFNTNPDLADSKGVGVYCWSGDKWKAMTGEDDKLLEVSPNKVVLSEFKVSDKALLAVGRSGQSWQALTTGVEESSIMKSVQNGKTAELTFTRSETVFGDKIYTFRLSDKPSVKAEVLVSNLGLTIGKKVIRVGEGNVNGAVNSSTAVVAFGADAKWEIVDYSKDVFNWTVAPQNQNGRLVFELGAVKNGATGSIRGEIRVRHINEPRLVRTIQIEQNKEYRVLPPFDYLVVKYGPASSLGSSSVDIDSATEILKSNVNSVDGQPVGYVGTAIKSASSNSTEYMFYAGDDTKSGSETSYVNIPELNKILVQYPNSSKQIEVGMSAWWYSNSTNVKNAIVTISVYKGGTMVLNGTTFDNKLEGVLQKPLLEFSSAPKLIKDRGSDTANSTTYKTKYTIMYKLEYDRIDNTGVLIPWIVRE